MNSANWWIMQSTLKMQTLCWNSNMGWTQSSRTTLPVSQMVDLPIMSLRIGMMLWSSVMRIVSQTLPSNQPCDPLEPPPLLKVGPITTQSQGLLSPWTLHQPMWQLWLHPSELHQDLHKTLLLFAYFYETPNSHQTCMWSGAWPNSDLCHTDQHW